MRTPATCLLLAALAAGCGGPAAAPPEPLRLAAASDLQAALPDLTRRFTELTGIRAEFTAGASGNLARQIRQGAPFDLFLSANRQYVDALAADGAIEPKSVRAYARGTLALAVSGRSPAAISQLQDLAQPGVRAIALANPRFAPYGLAGRQALERSGLWTQVEPRVVYAETVRQALQFVESGEADAGLVGRAIVDVPGVRAVEVDPALYDPIVQALGVVAGSKRPDAAERFARFLAGDDGRRVLARFGFLPPP